MTTGSAAPSSTRDTPWPLRVAAGATAVEGVVFLALSVFQLPELVGPKLAMNATTFAFFVIYGLFLLACAWQLLRLRSWARAPVVLAQVFQIILGAEFWGGWSSWTSLVAVSAVLVAVVALAGLFHPASVRALAAGVE